MMLRSRRQANFALIGAAISIAIAFALSLWVDDAPATLPILVMVVGIIQLALGMSWHVMHPIRRNP